MADNSRIKKPENLENILMKFEAHKWVSNVYGYQFASLSTHFHIVFRKCLRIHACTFTDHSFSEKTGILTDKSSANF